MEKLKTLAPKIDVDAAIHHAVGELRKSDVAIAQMRSQYLSLTVNGVDDKEGLQVVTEARKDVKKLRCAIEKRRKELKADADRFGKAVNTEANRLKEMIEPIESYLIDQETSVQRELDRLAAEAEAAKQAKIQQRIDRLNAARCRAEPMLIPLMDDEEFEEYFATEQAAAEKILKEQEAERLRLEEERKALEAQRAELERLQAAERQRLEEERQALAAQMRAEEDARRQREADEQKIRDAERAELERLQKIEAERKAAEEAAKLESQRKAAEEARLKRDAELKPIREQLQVLAKRVADHQIPHSLDAYTLQIQRILGVAAVEIASLAD